MIKTSKKIYVCAPASYASGGPEAMHQLAHSLLKCGKDVKIYYYGKVENGTCPRHKNYDVYDIPFIVNIDEIDNDYSSLMIIPETGCEVLSNTKLRKIRKCVWWLSVDFYFRAMENYNKRSFIKRLIKNQIKFPLINEIREMENVTHIPNSFYTFKFLKENLLNYTEVVSDYLNINYLTDNEICQTSSVKQNIIIYNPVKNGIFLEKIREKTPDLKWIAIQGMTQSEVKNLMNLAKVYIDFGFHPGRERMPREACLAKCCLIIGKDGAAKYKEDMPLKEYYHYESVEENIDKIVEVIHDCFINYKTRVKDFIDYEENIRDAENRFHQEVKNVFS